VHDRLREIALDAGLRGTMGGYARAYAEKHFAWTEHVAALLECYRSAAREDQQ
jgi:hypothetical protein